jgi:hypothetical protein
VYPTRRSGAVAQMGERCNRTAEVGGSNPPSSTKQHLEKLLEIKAAVLAASGRFSLG